MKMKRYLPVMLLSFAILGGTISHAQSSSSQPADTALQSYRKQIDVLDSSLIHILGERERVVKAVGVYKAKYNIAPLQADRFQQVVAKSVRAGTEEGLSPEFITSLMNLIHEESLKIENGIKHK